MIDPDKLADVVMPAKAWQVMNAMAAGATGQGVIEITQAKVAERLGMNQSTVSRYFKRIKNQNLVIQERNAKGRLHWSFNPEYLWNYKTDIRDDKVTKARKAAAPDPYAKQENPATIH